MNFSTKEATHLRMTWNIILIGLLFIELPLIAFLYEPKGKSIDDPLWLFINSHSKQAVSFLLFSFVTIVLVLWPSRQNILFKWQQNSSDGLSLFFGLVNLTILVILIIYTPELNRSTEFANQAPWSYFSMWFVGLLLTGLTLCLAIASLNFWSWLLRNYFVKILLAGAVALLIVLTTWLSQAVWHNLPNLTLELAYQILTGFESEVFIDRTEFILGAKDFVVRVGAPCSGYEGIGLITSFLTCYIFIYRSQLKFPHVFILFPFGIATIWILNAVRIALLIVIGANYSKEIAIGGFHSQAGWMMFLLVTVLIMVAVHNFAYFWRPKTTVKNVIEEEEYTVVCLTPFIILMFSNILVVTFAPQGYWIYSLTVTLLVSVFYYFRRHLLSLLSSFQPHSIFAGFAIGTIWLYTEPASTKSSFLSNWILELSPQLAFLWISLRIFTMVLLVPLTEELAFREFMYKLLSGSKMSFSSPFKFSWFAFLTTSLAFGLLHDRWTIATVTGGIFAAMTYRSGKLSDAIVAHIAANSTIAAWILLTHNWTLL